MHGFTREFPTVDIVIGINVAFSFLSNPGFYSVVAEGTEVEVTRCLEADKLQFIRLVSYPVRGQYQKSSKYSIVSHFSHIV